MLKGPDKIVARIQATRGLSAKIARACGTHRSRSISGNRCRRRGCNWWRRSWGCRPRKSGPTYSSRGNARPRPTSERASRPVACVQPGSWSGGQLPRVIDHDVAGRCRRRARHRGAADGAGADGLAQPGDKRRLAGNARERKLRLLHAGGRRSVRLGEAWNRRFLSCVS